MRRALTALFLAGILATAGVVAVHVANPDWYVRWRYPLEYTGIIVQYSQKNALDPALVAAVIFQESGFEPASESAAGAVGLMQLMPGTAAWIAGNTGGADFTVADLGDPEVNIAYGCWYLGYLLDRYDGSEALALAAYNGGTENVDDWVKVARGEGRGFSTVDDIPYKETRDFVRDVSKGKEAYARVYSRELGY
ncbi:soluble lytic murein transglycosylase precursor [bacterium BMS3Abin01]|nr:soluble lytic murein transglycosylase precursor [bacterium BMS3Abin01]